MKSLLHHQRNIFRTFHHKTVFDHRAGYTGHIGFLEDILANQEHLKPLTASQLMRGRQLLKTSPHFKFKEELNLSLELGGWLEQEKN